MFCTSCGAFDSDAEQRCSVCGALLERPARSGGLASSGSAIRWALALLPIMVLLLGIGLGVERWRERQAGMAAVYQQAEAALAAGDYAGAELSFGALGGYRDADDRLVEVQVAADPVRHALEQAAATFDAGDYAGAIVELEAIVAQAPEFGPAQDLLASSTAARIDQLHQQVSSAEANHDWLSVELATRELVRLQPEDADLAARLAEIVRAHAPIVFVRDGAIFIIGPDGNDERGLTTEMGAIFPSWSPDRSQIAFISVADEESYNGTLMLMNGNGSELRAIAKEAMPYSWPVWSPDGRGIAFSSLRGFDSDTLTGSISLNVFEVETGIERNLTGDQLPYAAVPTWSPDGKELAFISNVLQRRSGGGIDLRDGDVFVVSANGGAVRDVTRNRIFEESWVQWSPSGSRLLILTAPGDWLTPAMSRLYLIDLERDELEEIVVEEWQMSLPFWSPEGTRIAYITGGDTANIWSDSDVEQVRLSSDVSSFVSWSPDGRHLFVPAANETLPSFVISTDDGNVTPFELDYNGLHNRNGPPNWGGITPLRVEDE
jgi:Tol biopolymer transport system component